MTREYGRKVYQDNWQRENPEAFKRAQHRAALKYKYGITLEQYEALLTQQNGLCAICHNLPGKKRLGVDHDHTTGKVRSLLCNSCNTLLTGLENKEWLEKAFAYLKAHEEVRSDN